MNRIRDFNKVFLEGTVVDNPLQIEANGKVALNFTVESRVCGEGDDKFYRHGCVLWGDNASKYKSLIKNGVFLRMEGHLQSATLNYIDEGVARTLYYDKINVKYIEADE